MKKNGNSVMKPTDSSGISRRMTISIRAILKLCAFLVLCAVALEVASYFAFHKMISPQLRDSALFAGQGKLPNTDSFRIPIIEPYIWSNYKPNPLSDEVNAYGWRYGGGPKNVPFRILCIGGSTTWSIKASSSEYSYPAQLEVYLRQKGYNLDVVNGSCSYYSSAELVGMLAFRGIYTEPDLIIIHTGGNDIGPLMSPQEYEPDYTHWRTTSNLNTLSHTDIFRAYWKIPSWTLRLLMTVRIRPNAFSATMVGNQLTSAAEELLAQNNIDSREPVGLRNNLYSLIALSRVHGAEVVSLTFNFRYENLDGLVPQIRETPALRQEVIDRVTVAIDKSNYAIQQVCEEMNVPVIPFHTFEPSMPEYWTDQCHLTEEGCKEKAVFIGDLLIQLGLLPDARE